MIRFAVVDRVLVVTLERPLKRNALIPDALITGRHELLRQAVREDLVAVVLRGAGSFFCAGYDLESIPSVPGGDGRMVGPLDDFVAVLAGLDVPTVAVVQGGAYGAGFELALACDLRLTTETARWCMPPARLGLLYSLEGMCRLQRAIGEQRARYLLMTAAVIHGEQAARWGLAFEALHDADALEVRCDALLDQLRSVHRASLQGTKRLLRSVEPALEPALLAESEALRAELFAAAELPPKR